MSFAEQLKLKIKRRAAFRCCRCHEIGIEVHHILPQVDGGPDTEENAAPLCPNCHTSFGPNPEKRKEIKQMTDWWFEVCDKKFGQGGIEERLDQLLAEVRANRENEQLRNHAVQQLQDELRRIVGQSLPLQSDTDSVVVAKVNQTVTATRLGQGVYANVQCRKCNSYTGLLIGSDSCPTCGAKL